MPISRNNRLYFTPEQKERAGQNSSALEYALSQGYDLVREGSYYKMRDHDSMVFKPDGTWFWNSRHLHGRAPEFIVHYEGLSYVEAILKLAGDDGIARTGPPAIPKPTVPQYTPPPFKPPPKAESCRQLFAYLCKTRKLDPDVVREMLSQGILYQADKLLDSGQTVHRACFVSYNDTGQPCSVFKRGLSADGPPYKREVPGGDKHFGWVLHGKNPTHLYIFEASIDAASYVSLGMRIKSDPLSNADYLALGGLMFSPVQNYLSSHPDIQCVHLMLDNDQAGREASEQFQKKLRDMGFTVRNHLPPRGKDWNEYLQSLPAHEKIRAPPEQSEDQRNANGKAAAMKKRSGHRHKDLER